ncbi:hypothetical protein MJO28_015614 [Puccinia striiformis f. sp. tritici]|uniref:Uncharacterized protein n=1 Tax=Puccinia striiformis f. sp. tritici TaxID=168172 RepID=A0ACC0DP75_9BASI|nr:hypothetical protein MJO28_015614 [Puccinia striiformis f. sp. tritici]
MKIINSFQPPHITSLILAIVVTSHQALAATTPAVTPRTCDQYFFLGKTPGVSSLIPDAPPCCLQYAEVTTCRTNASLIVAKWVTNLVSYDSNLVTFCEVAGRTAAIFKNCELLDKQRGKVIPGHKLPMVIPLQYHVEDAGLDVPKQINPMPLEPVSHSQIDIKLPKSHAEL